MLQAYIDDSTSESGEKFFYLAGYIASTSTWELFTKDWDQSLAAFQTIKHLHCVDANALKNEFNDFAPHQRDKKLMQLGRVINKYKPLSIECRVSKKLYDEVVRPNAPYFLRTPYFICFYGIINSLFNFLKAQNLMHPVSFIFDDQGNLGNQTALWKDYIMSLHPEVDGKLLDIQFKNDQLAPPLQASDMLVWHLRRESEDRGEDLKPLELIRNTHLMTEIDKKMLENITSGFLELEHIEPLKKRAVWNSLKNDVSYRLTRGLGPPVPISNIPRKQRKKSIFTTIRSKLSRLVDKF